MRRALVKRLIAMRTGAEPMKAVELERELRIAADLDARRQSEGPLSRMVRDLFDVHLDDVRDGLVPLDVAELGGLTRLVNRFVLQGRFRQSPKRGSAFEVPARFRV
jgi:hypothetical protein